MKASAALAPCSVAVGERRDDYGPVGIDGLLVWWRDVA